MSAAARLSAHGLAVAVTAALAGGGLAALSSGQAWLHGPATAGAPGGRVSGTLAVPLVLAAGLVGLAAGGGLLGTSGIARRMLGALLAILGAAAAAFSVLAVARPATTYRNAALESGGSASEVGVTITAWPFLALLGLVAVVFAGVLALARGSGWGTLGRRYERAPAAPATDWDALDAGQDPTAAPRSQPGPGPAPAPAASGPGSDTVGPPDR